jgi:hypothetical protein
MTAEQELEHDAFATRMAMLCKDFFDDDIPGESRLSITPLIMAKQGGSKGVSEMGPSDLVEHWRSIQVLLSAHLAVLWQEHAAVMPLISSPKMQDGRRLPPVPEEFNAKYDCIMRFDQWSRAWIETRARFKAAEADLANKEGHQGSVEKASAFSWRPSTETNRTLARQTTPDGIDILSTAFAEVSASIAASMAGTLRRSTQSAWNKLTELVMGHTTGAEANSVEQ